MATNRLLRRDVQDPAYVRRITPFSELIAQSAQVLRQRFPGRRVFYGAALILMQLGLPPYSLGNTSERAALLEAASGGWERLSAEVAQVNGTITEISDTVVLDTNTHYVAKAVKQFWLSKNANKLAFEIWNDGEWQSSRVMGTNSKYAYVAEQKVQGGPFSITECSDSKRARARVKNIIGFSSKNWLESSHRLESDERSLLEILGERSTRIVKQAKVERAGRHLELVHLEFMPVGLAAEQHSGATHASVLLDPEADWRVVESSSEYKLKAGETVTSGMKVTYSSDPMRNSDVTAVEWHLNDVESSLADTMEVSIVYDSPTPPAEFYLPAIGLPDCPSLVVNNTGGWKPLLIGINLLILGALLSMAYRRYRHRKSDDGSSEKT